MKLTLAISTLALPATSLAAFQAPTDWSRPTTESQAVADRTTYQEWQRFNAPAGPNLPNDGITGDATDTGALDGLFYVNPNDTASPADDANVVDNSGLSFVTSSGNIYSPSASLQPSLNFPGYDVAGGQTSFVVNLRTQGQEIVVSDGPAGDALTVNGSSVETLPGYSYERLFEQGLGGFGGTLVDHRWTFTAPDADTFDLVWAWGASSTSLDAVAVDTQTIPEPSAALAALALPLLARRRR